MAASRVELLRGRSKHVNTTTTHVTSIRRTCNGKTPQHNQKNNWIFVSSFETATVLDIDVPSQSQALTHAMAPLGLHRTTHVSPEELWKSDTFVPCVDANFSRGALCDVQNFQSPCNVEQEATVSVRNAVQHDSFVKEPASCSRPVRGL